jgi:hypothetical protein
MRWVAWTCKVVVDWAGQSVHCLKSLFLAPERPRFGATAAAASAP